MTNSTRLAGIYLLTPDAHAAGFDAVLTVVAQALDAGVRVVQYRDKSADDERRLDRACRLIELAHNAGALLIINDSADIAARCSADGVHLGRDDGDIAHARRALPEKLIGVSCYNKIDRARVAIAAGADAIAFGSMFASVTKPAAVKAPLTLLAEARGQWPQRRIIAIGGINIGNVAQVAAAGAHAAAVLDAVYGAKDPAAAACALIRQFDRGKLQHEEQRSTV